jgi:peptide/nickel transport system substrate-binding protein
MRILLQLAAAVFSLLSCAVAQDRAELRWCIHTDPKNFDPLLASEEASNTVAYLTSGVLIRHNRGTAQLEPELASAWRVYDGGRRIDFTLRPNIRFSDGSPFGPEDVVASIRRLNDPNLHSAIADTFRSAGGAISATARTPSEVTVLFTTARAGLEELFDQLAISKAQAPVDGRIVLGPYVVDRYEPGSYVLLRRNPRYWKTDAAGRRLPYTESIRLIVQANRETESLRFRRGEIDLLDKMDAESFERLKKARPEAVRDAGSSLDAEFFWFNQSPAGGIPEYKQRWFRSTAFRQAISRSVNRVDIARLVYLGHAQAAAGPLSPANRLWYNAALPNPAYDPAGAMKLLQAEGFRLDGRTLRDRQGNRVEFSLVTNADSRTRTQIGALVQQDLEKIGVRVNFTPLEFQSLIERVMGTQAYEACLLGLSNTEIDPNEETNVWLSSGTHHAWHPGQTKPATDWEAEIDRLVKLQATAPTFARRKAAFDGVQRIFGDQVPIIYLVYPNVLVGVAPHVRGASPSVFTPHLFWNVEYLSIGSTVARLR